MLLQSSPRSADCVIFSKSVQIACSLTKASAVEKKLLMSKKIAFSVTCTLLCDKKKTNAFVLYANQKEKQSLTDKDRHKIEQSIKS